MSQLPNPPGMPSAETEIRADEGVRRAPYKDSLGRWCQGVGCDLAAHGLLDGPPNGQTGNPRSMEPWTDAMINHQLDLDIMHAQALLNTHLPWASNRDPVRYRVLLNMIYNMGWLSPHGNHGLGTFVRTLGFVKDGNYAAAAEGMGLSLWASQVGARAKRLEARMLTGEYYPGASTGHSEGLFGNSVVPGPQAPPGPVSACATPTVQPRPMVSILVRELLSLFGHLAHS